MSGEKSSVRIDIPNALPPCSGSKDLPPRRWMRDVWVFAKEDTNRVAFSLKVGLAMLLVSLLILFRAPFQVFGASNIVWAILTVALMFEYTVGATFNKGFNRVLGSLLAGIFAISVAHVAMSSGRFAEPYVIGISIFLVGAVTSFMKLWPSLVPYEYGFRVSLFTYCLVVVYGYRMGDPIRTAMDRLCAVAIGVFITVLVNVFVFPIWAGEQLHKELVKNFNSVADSLEECVKKYLTDDGSDHPEFSKIDFPDEPAFRKCRAILNSSTKLDSLANSAKWEPPHGRFRHFYYPWSEYVKVGAVLRHCAYEVMALQGCLHSEIQAPYSLRCTFQSEILDATNQAAELLRSLSRDISNMKHNIQTSLLKRVHSSTESLQRSIGMHSYLLTSSHDCAKRTPAKLSTALSFYLKELPSYSTEPGEKVDPDAREAMNLKLIQTIQTAVLVQADSYHETMRKQDRRLYSWPSREVDEFEQDGVAANLMPRMRTLESTATLSLATFTSLLVEFVARLDQLVDAVDELAKMAKFERECRS